MRASRALLGGAVVLLLASSIAMIGAEGPPPRPGDYLSAELREQVETLKGDAEAPTTPDDIQQRARVLADWIDAYALSGGHVSLDATSIRGIATTLPTATAMANQLLNVDLHIAEFRLRDDQPDAIGTLRADSLGPFTARSFASISQTYTAGSKPVQQGGGFWIARQIQADYSRFQTSDPKGEGYISIRSSDAGIRFVSETIMRSGPHGGFRTPAPALKFRISEGQLDAGESVTITYGDTTDGGPGLRVQSFTTERMPLPVYVDFDGRTYVGQVRGRFVQGVPRETEQSHWISLPLNEFVVVGAGVTGVHGFAPSVVEPGEKFELRVRAEDADANRATGPIPAFDVLVNGERRATTKAGTEAIQTVPLQLDAEGAYWFTLRSTDGRIEGISNPVLVQKNPEHRIYWGDTHGHSGYAEGVGTMDYFMRFARDDARLDFVTHSEHDTWMDDWEWEQMRTTTQKYFDEGRFVPFLGYEWTVPAVRGGHHNVLFRTPEGRARVSALSYPTLPQLYAGLQAANDAADVLTIPHAHNPGDYRFSSSALEPLIEIMSMHGTFEWFLKAYLSHGHTVGFVAASDDHVSHPGYSTPRNESLSQRGGLAAVMAPSGKRDALFDAMKARRTYATTGDRMILDVRLNGIGMGQRAPYDTRRELRGRVIATAPIESITVLRNDTVVWEKDYLTQTTAAIADGDYLLTFASEAQPTHRGDAPRGWRHWRGTLTVQDGELQGAQLLDQRNAVTQRIERDGNVLRFRTATRGDTSSLRLRLRGVSAQTALVLALEETTETGGAPPMFRPPATIPAQALTLTFADLGAGRHVQAVPFEIYNDSVTLRHVVADGVLDVPLHFVDDNKDPRQGDYYYVRVRQVNDAIAWSSPIWVGGYAHQ